MTATTSASIVWAPRVTLSVVSHGQNALVNQLLADIERHCARHVALIVTENVPDEIPLQTQALSCPVQIIVNSRRKGFGANHNAAFTHCNTPYFCVANPDIRLRADPFPALMRALSSAGVAVAGPVVRNPAGGVEDSARRFPTAGILIRKLLGQEAGFDYCAENNAVEVDWIAGMFMLFRQEAFKAVKGFDEAYFLYYEDVDICYRLRKEMNQAVLLEPLAEVVHDARRESHRNPRLAMHHIASIARFLSRSRAE